MRARRAPLRRPYAGPAGVPAGVPLGAAWGWRAPGVGVWCAGGVPGRGLRASWVRARRCSVGCPRRCGCGRGSTKTDGWEGGCNIGSAAQRAGATRGRTRARPHPLYRISNPARGEPPCGLQRGVCRGVCRAAPPPPPRCAPGRGPWGDSRDGHVNKAVQVFISNIRVPLLQAVEHLLEDPPVHLQPLRADH